MSPEKPPEIGKFFDAGETAIAEARRLFSGKLDQDKDLREKVEKVKNILKL